MALSAQAALLDELMGKNRNAGPNDRVKNHHFTDSDVCKHFLCGFCPHDLFVNTRADLGPCHKLHDESLRRQYEQSSRKGKLGYEEDFESVLRSLLSDVEKRIKKGKDRLSLTQGTEDRVVTIKSDRMTSLNEQIDQLISEADRLGRSGNLDAAQEALDKCEKLKIERLELETRVISAENTKAMEVCNVCGSFLIVGDAQCRVEEHITGKQHVGFAKIRSTLEQIKVEREKIVEERRKARELKAAQKASPPIRHRSRSPITHKPQPREPEEPRRHDHRRQRRRHEERSHHRRHRRSSSSNGQRSRRYRD